MPTPLTPEWLESVGFEPYGQNEWLKRHGELFSRRCVLRVGRLRYEQSEPGWTIAIEYGAMNESCHVPSWRGTPHAVREQVRAAWFMLTGQHLEGHDGAAGVLLDAIDECRWDDVKSMAYALPALRECLVERPPSPVKTVRDVLLVGGPPELTERWGASFRRMVAREPDRPLTIPVPDLREVRRPDLAFPSADDRIQLATYTPRLIALWGFRGVIHFHDSMPEVFDLPAHLVSEICRFAADMIEVGHPCFSSRQAAMSR